MTLYRKEPLTKSTALPINFHATLLTYVHVLRADLFQFPCAVIFNGFFKDDEQKPKLVSAHPPNSQTFKQIESCC